MPLTDKAYWPGDTDREQGNYPRCTARPTREDRAGNRAFRRDTWECALPAGHEKFSNPRHVGHSWVQTGEDD
ncbi:MAG TPA: hypothetical protein VES42_16260 [Pilimelia sp.]|nr:hypothetical protein [Pilimelia sp.]